MRVCQFLGLFILYVVVIYWSCLLFGVWDGFIYAFFFVVFFVFLYCFFMVPVSFVIVFFSSCCWSFVLICFFFWFYCELFKFLRCSLGFVLFGFCGFLF